MCGIIGFNFKSSDDKIFSVANHRGPDSASKIEIGSFTLAHNRLSIIDHNELSNQPMVSECGRYAIVFNGEVYNHNDIRKKLKNKYNFKTESDAEVVLCSYIEYGDSCVDEFRGMFSFAIYDKELDRLFCARDRIGIKPFLYYCKDGKFIFASEINVVLQALGEIPKINKSAMRQYMKYLYISYPDTIFTDIIKLPPAHTLVYQNGKMDIERYWNIEDFIGKNDNLKEVEILERLDDLLNESVKMMMFADAEIGSFLSGGLDSSLILYYMNKHSTKSINTYTLGFRNADRYDETSDAKIMSNLYSTNHNEIIIEPKISELLPKMIRHFGEPFANPTGLLIYELTKEVKKTAAVALAGDGGDEVFGGYPKYRAIQIAEKLRLVPKFIWKIANMVVGYIPEPADGNHFPRRLKAFFGALQSDYADMYDSWSGYIDDKDLEELFIDKKNFRKIVSELWLSQNKGDGTIKSSIVDLRTCLPNNMLYYGDIMSMANSFQVRFPLIDHKIIEFMTSISSEYRIKNGETKYLMKRLLKGKIPDSILNKKKLGLNPPIGIWLKNDLRGLIDDYLSEESISNRGIFDYVAVRKIIDSFQTNKKDTSLNIWALIVLEEWFRQYIDRKGK